MGWIIGTVVVLAGVAVVLGRARDASLARRIARETARNDEPGPGPTA